MVTSASESVTNKRETSPSLLPWKMSVLLETTLGEIVIDLEVQRAPTASLNFLKLCKAKFYNFSLIHSVQQGFLCQTGRPASPSSPEMEQGESIWG